MERAAASAAVKVAAMAAVSLTRRRETERTGGTVVARAREKLEASGRRASRAADQLAGRGRRRSKSEAPGSTCHQYQKPPCCDVMQNLFIDWSF